MLFQAEAIRPGLWRIWDGSHTAFYLVEGQNAAALIDSGVGVGNVIRVCEDVLAGHSDAVPFRGPFGDSAVIAKEMDLVRFCRVDGGEGNIVYNTGKVRNN